MQHRYRIIFVLLFFAFFALPFGIPKQMPLVDRQITPKASCMVGDKLHNDVVHKLHRRKPEIILIGNSMLGEAINQNKLSNLQPYPAASLWMGGSSSAWWYLVVKNIIPQMHSRPRLIGIFFRDNTLTLPKHRVTGKHKEFIDDFALKDEDMLDRIAYLSQQHPALLFMQKYLPVFNKREYYKRKFDLLLKDTLAGFYHLDDSAAVNHSIAETFAQQKMNNLFLHQRQMDDEKESSGGQEKMHFSPEQTFLPLIIQHCHKQGIPLVFIRVKRRRDLQPNQQSKELLTYIAELKKYLHNNGVTLIDYTNNQAIKLEHFGNGDHLNRQVGKQLFTSMLAADLQHLPALQ